MSKLSKMLLRCVAFAMLLIAAFVVCCALFLNHRSDPPDPAEACIENLKQIEGAKAVWELEHLRQTNHILVWNDILGDTNYIQRKPTCPSGGTYILGLLKEPPRCSIPEHALP